MKLSDERLAEIKKDFMGATRYLATTEIKAMFDHIDALTADRDALAIQVEAIGDVIEELLRDVGRL